MIFTVGHGARSAEQLVAILKAAGVGTLIDVRAYPASRRHPQFSREPLASFLRSCAISYEWQGKALGGMRRSYADHMQTAAFQYAAAALMQREKPCIMCAESDPADCHRSYISDWLVSQGRRVVHLLGEGKRREHPARLI